jgi:acetolactate synthase-1/2/3 large subunit
MSGAPVPRSGAEILIAQLRIHGVDTIFGVPGESYLSVLDAMRDANFVRYVVCRHEGGAANMAEADGKLTGRPGICFVTRGPGATNASIGVHTAMQDSTPMILFVGQIGRRERDREAFQEIEYRRMFASLAKWTVEIDLAVRIPELVSQAFHRATNGRPGPVVVALPKDVLEEVVRVADAEPYGVARAAPRETDLGRLRQLLERSRRPMVIAGGAGWTGQAARDLVDWAGSFSVPVACSFRRQDCFDNLHPCYIGDLGAGPNPRLIERVRESDLILAFGPRLGEITTGGYSLLEAPKPQQALVHVHCDAEELGRVYRADLPILSDITEFMSMLRAMSPPESIPWRARTFEAHAEYRAYSEPEPARGRLDLGEILLWLRGRLPLNAIVTNGAGNYTGWVHRFHRFRQYGTQLAPTSGAMGYGVPAAIAAKLRNPSRTVVAFAGDGCFLMTGQELATAAQFGVNVVVIIVNNGMYGTIRMHQERDFPGREFGTALANPDFAAYARSFGGHGERVERTEEFAPAFERALAAGVPAAIELRVDPNIATTRATLSAIREESLRRRAARSTAVA